MALSGASSNHTWFWFGLSATYGLVSLKPKP
uniref:Uncharacterized protein n=1 Tax=Anguilla anguilla TaxID=7936 RepID=A0A0E9XD79_ANGAN